jgi:recombination protein RecR
MAFYLLERDRGGASKLAAVIQQAVEQMGHCASCRTLSETDLCALCANTQRDESVLCVVETPVDMLALEQATDFKGKYFVLMGHLSPLDGIGPAELGLDKLEDKMKQQLIKEVILATNHTVEGETTAHYISQMAAEYAIQATRLAHGIPIGGELEYIDGGTLAHAFSGRQKLMF